MTFYLVGAPDGLNINASNQIVGNALSPGTYTFYTLAEASGYANTLSAAFSLVVSQVATPLVISNPSVVGAPTTPAIEVNNTPFLTQWSIVGTPNSVRGVLFLQSGSVSGPRDVTGATQAATSQPTTSVLSVYGASFYGNAYTIPVIVLSSSIQASQQLLPAPTVGTLDEHFNLTLNWQPYIVAAGYGVYAAWDIYLNQPPALPPLGLQTIDGNLPTGLEFPGSSVSNRIYETSLSAGDWTSEYDGPDLESDNGDEFESVERQSRIPYRFDFRIGSAKRDHASARAIADHQPLAHLRGGAVLVRLLS